MTPGFDSQALTETLGGGNFVVRRQLVYTSLDGTITVVIPEGTVTDFASSYILGGYFNFLPRAAQLSRAGILHDAIYRNVAIIRGAKRSRKLADLLFKEALELDNISTFQSRKAYMGLRLFGGGPYKD